MASTEDDLNGRRPEWKTTSIEEDLNRRRPQWKMTSMEYDLNRRRPQLAMLCAEFLIKKKMTTTYCKTQSILKLQLNRNSSKTSLQDGPQSGIIIRADHPIVSYALLNPLTLPSSWPNLCLPNFLGVLRICWPTIFLFFWFFEANIYYGTWFQTGIF